MAQKFLNTGASAWEEKTRIYFLTKLSKWENKAMLEEKEVGNNRRSFCNK